MSRSGGTNRTVFVGNIPYEATEELLRPVFEEVGHVAALRLVSDPATGKPKGFGFVEYRDAETARSAMRNLNGYEFNGRALRVDYNEDGGGGGGGGGRSSSSGDGRGDRGYADSRGGRGGGGGGGSMPPPPQQQQTAIPDAAAAQEMITAAVERMNAQQLYEVAGEMQTFVQSDRDQARKLLTQNPQLCYALLQVQMLLTTRFSGPTDAVPGAATSSAPPQPPAAAAAPASAAGAGGGMNPQLLQLLQSLGDGVNVNDPVALQQQLQTILSVTPQQMASLPRDQRAQIEQVQSLLKSQLGL